MDICWPGMFLVSHQANKTPKLQKKGTGESESDWYILNDITWWLFLKIYLNPRKIQEIKSQFKYLWYDIK